MSTRQALLAYLQSHGSATGKELCDHLGISRQALNVHIRALIDTGVIVKSGSTRAARYHTLEQAPRPAVLERRFGLKGLDEGRVYEEISARLNFESVLNPNVRAIVHYAFTEMLNNAIEHSGTDRGRALIRLGTAMIEFEVRDDGIGAFRSIADKYDLNDEYEAMIELIKGRTTTAPQAHTGEGIFFTARAADRFVLRSHRIQIEWDWARDDVFVAEPRFRKGTTVEFQLRRSSRKRLEDVFSRFAPEDYDYHFEKTAVAVKLLKSEYVSRSEAKRLVANLEKFREVELDFKGVSLLGQGFADEVFRVFAGRHPGTAIRAVNAGPAIASMIRHARRT